MGILTATNRNKRRLEAALGARHPGANLLSFDGRGVVFSLPEDAGKRYYLKFQLNLGEVELAEERQNVEQEIVIPEELPPSPGTEADPGIVGTPRTVLDRDEMRLIYGKTFCPRKNQIDEIGREGEFPGDRARRPEEEGERR